MTENFGKNLDSKKNSEEKNIGPERHLTENIVKEALYTLKLPKINLEPVLVSQKEISETDIKELTKDKFFLRGDHLYGPLSSAEKPVFTDEPLDQKENRRSSSGEHIFKIFDSDSLGDFALMFERNEEKITAVKMKDNEYVPVIREIPPKNVLEIEEGKIKNDLKKRFLEGKTEDLKDKFEKRTVELVNRLLNKGGYITLSDYSRDSGSYRGMGQIEKNSLYHYNPETKELELLISNNTSWGQGEYTGFDSSDEHFVKEGIDANLPIEDLIGNNVNLYSETYTCYNGIDTVNYRGICVGGERGTGEDIFISRWTSEVIQELLKEQKVST